MKEKIEKFAWRHGDVIVIKLDTKIKEVGEESPPVLALGENTGHSHRIKNPKSAALCATTFNDEVYDRIWDKLDPTFKKDIRRQDLKSMGFRHLKMKRQDDLTHEEHLCFTLPAGDFAVIIQQEWKEDGWTKVID